MNKATLFLLAVAACVGGSMLLPKPAPSPPIPAPAPLPSVEPGDLVPWLVYQPKKATTNAAWGQALTDIEQHLDPKHGRTYFSADNITHGHETTHGINSDIRNTLGGPGKNGFYCLDGRACVLAEPKCRIRDVAPLVPAVLRGSRYNLYLVQQAHAWDDSPLYLLDEWVAYINGTTVGIDQVKRGLLKGRSGGSSDDAIAPMEFTYYVLALCRAIKERDPGYFAAHPEFGEFVAFNVRRSAAVFREAIVMEQFRWDAKLVDAFAVSGDAKPLRDVAAELWGPAFVAKHLVR